MKTVCDLGGKYVGTRAHHFPLSYGNSIWNVKLFICFGFGSHVNLSLDLRSASLKLGDVICQGR